MKRLAKIFSVTCVAAFALAAVATGASAATTFTASATGEVTSKSTTTQTFTVGGANVVKCTSFHGTGKIESIAGTSTHLTINPSGCSATFFGLPAGTVDMSAWTLTFTPNGNLHIKNVITIKATGLGCETIISSGQTLSSVSYTNEAGKIKAVANVSGIVSTSPNGCPSGTTGTYTGTNLWERVGGGSISVD